MSDMPTAQHQRNVLMSLDSSIFLHILSYPMLNHKDLARLECTCKFFKNAAYSDVDLSLPELAALTACKKRSLYSNLTAEEKDGLKQQCGGSWKLVLRFIVARERCSRWGKPQVIAGNKSSIAISSNGGVSFFDAGSLEDGPFFAYRDPLPVPLEGLKIVQAAEATWDDAKYLVSDEGRIYYILSRLTNRGILLSSLGAPVEIFTVQVTQAGDFTVALSRDGRVYQLTWHVEYIDNEPAYDFWEGNLISGDEAIIQISCGKGFLLMLSHKPGVMSVCLQEFSLTGKLQGGITIVEMPENFNPVMVSASFDHYVALAEDGRVCTLEKGSCPGQHRMRVIEGLIDVKATYVSAGYQQTFVVTEDSKIYFLGEGDYFNIHQIMGRSVKVPELVEAMCPPAKRWWR